MHTSVTLRPARHDDAAALTELYRRVAATPGGLARLEDEIDPAYVDGFLSKSLRAGVCLVAESAEGLLLGEIHACSPGIFCFSHVYSELTIAVSPDHQGRGIGRALFERLMDIVVNERPEILRVELIGRESNGKALGFYESLGFLREGVLRGRIRNLDGSLESDIPMAWTRSSG